jgi:hypothetical protein
MAWGPGKYDDICTEVRVRTAAECAIVIIIGGNRGHGFAVQTFDMKIAEKLPELLRNVADQIEDKEG